MTTKEAIEILTNVKNTPQITWTNGADIALDLAIKALMAYRDCRHCTHNIKVGNMRGCALWDCDFEDVRGEKE